MAVIHISEADAASDHARAAYGEVDIGLSVVSVVELTHGIYRARTEADQERRLDFFGGLGDDRCRGLETDLGVGSVAEWLVGRCSAATERDGGFAGQIYKCTVGIH
jgi:hypothetical protein